MNADNFQRKEIYTIILKSQRNDFKIERHRIQLGFCFLNKTKISTGY